MGRKELSWLRGQPQNPRPQTSGSSFQDLRNRDEGDQKECCVFLSRWPDLSEPLALHLK